MIYRSLVRALITSAALAAGVMLAGCNSDEISLAQNAKANQPVNPKLIAAMVEKDMDLQSPILVRLFKQEAELEVWKQTRSGRFALLKTYPICRWSGDLGPKVREGDRQAPEGFYSITPAQMNPQSAYYLSFNTGFPNAFDRALGRTGSELMVHGDCSSRGCYAMTDEQIAEIYSLGRESFFGGQRGFQFQAYPFHMTPVNMARHRNNPNMPFWRMIKEGNDHFEVTKQEPKVDFCEKKYVFDAVKAPNATRDPVSKPRPNARPMWSRTRSPSAVRQKEQEDDAEMARLVAKGTPVARLNTGIDGGMNKVFAAAVPDGNTGLSESAEPRASRSAIPVCPERSRWITSIRRTRRRIIYLAGAPEQPKLAAVPATAAGSPTQTQVASAAPREQSGGFFSNLARKVGFSSAAAADTTASAAPPTQPAPTQAEAAEARHLAKPDTKQAAAKPALKPSVTDTSSATAAAAAPAPAAQSFAGAQPIVSSNSFDNRFSAAK